MTETDTQHTDARSLTEAVAAAVAAESLSPKPWYLSRAVWGGIIAAGSALAGLVGLEVDQGAALEIALQVSALIGGALAIWGRVRATRPIRVREVAA